jgi:hypothetical protein
MLNNLDYELNPDLDNQVDDTKREEIKSFLSSEKYIAKVKGINVYALSNMHPEIGVNEKEKLNKEKLMRSCIDCINSLETLLSKKRIKPRLNELFKNILFLKGGSSSDVEVRDAIDNYNPMKKKLSKWKALYIQFDDLIIVDVESFINSGTLNNHKLVNSLVHEVGHSIHLKYITKGSKTYYDFVSRKFVELLNELKVIPANYTYKLSSVEKDKIENYFLDSWDEMLDSIVALTEDGVDKSKSIDFTTYLNDLFEENLKSKNTVKSMIDALVTLLSSNEIYYKDREFNRSFGVMQSEFESIPTEDFAETFRMFIFYEDRMSQWNRNRLFNTFEKSKARGRTIIENKKNSINIIKNYILHFIKGVR